MMRKYMMRKGPASGKKAQKRKERIATVQKAVLWTLAATGGLAMAVVAPNALRVLEQFGWVKTKRRPHYSINKSVERLLRSGLIFKDSRNFIFLAKKGEHRLAQIKRERFQLKKPRYWDKKWRIISFDIKEIRREVRDQLRATLEAVGFVRLHRSTWVYPYECQDFITLLKADFEIGKDILYVVAEYIENDGWLRRHFGLG